jgi:hypothetical protein
MEIRNIFLERFERGQKELYEFIGYLFLIFLTPLVLGHMNGLPNQIFIGSAVNFLLVMSAMYVSGWKNLLVILVPSIGAYLSGVVFGPASVFLLYFVPAIWLGNFVYVYLIKKLVVKEQKNFVFGIVYSSVAKAALLFLVAVVLVQLSIVPKPFLFAMGPLQLVTALSGGFVGALVNVYRK